MTNQTLKDMTAIDGLILYIIDCVKYEAEIVPWFLSSDSLEQLFSWLRVGRYEGRRTNLDYLTVVQGTGKSNQNYAMDGNRTFGRHGHLSDTDICPKTCTKFCGHLSDTDICPTISLQIYT